MADDSTIIEGTVKFRDGKKWKSRWCVMRKLSPVADCVHLQLYRDARARYNAAGGGGGSSGGGGGGRGLKAALSLQQFVGAEAGFTLDKQSNTLALVCQDLVAILAFETRERLMQWQVKVNAHLGEARQYVVVLAARPGRRGAGAGAGPGAGPARLLLRERCCALTAGAPPRLLGVWQLQHLRRYGVVEGKFCFEGGSLCGAGEGLHVLVSDQAPQLARDFELAARGRLRPQRHARTDGGESPKSNKAFRPDTRLSELSSTERLPPTDLPLDTASNSEWADAGAGAAAGAGAGDAASVHGVEAAWNSGTTLGRCMSCMSKLGALSRSSTAALTPGSATTPGSTAPGAAAFSPAWTMDAPPAPCHCAAAAPPRPPKPEPLACACRSKTRTDDIGSKIGPYENYDVPKVPSAEVEGEYYDTPKRLKECLKDELFTITKSATSDAVILKKPCGCLLRFGKRRRAATVVETEESLQPASCPCRRVTDWAHSWIRLPYCRRAATPGDGPGDKENLTPNDNDRTALYATIDVSRKTKRKASLGGGGGREPARSDDAEHTALANYENLSFAQSLEHYENARALLRRAGVTRAELRALAAAPLPPAARPAPPSTPRCACRAPTAADEYLLMEPNGIEPLRLEARRAAPAGYTPMSPIGGFAFHTLRLPARAARCLGEEKSASNPALCAAGGAAGAAGAAGGAPAERAACGEYRKRSSSADSSRFLDDVKEFDGSAGSRGSSSSVETLRDAAPGSRAATPCGCRELAGAAGAGAAAAGGAPGNRDSSSSNDSGVSSCSLRRAAPHSDCELPQTTAAARRRYRSARRAALPPGAAPPRRARSSDAPRLGPADAPLKSSSAEAEVPLLSLKALRGMLDTPSSSSGASDMSDYIETLSICSSHSSTDTPVTMRLGRQCASVLRPRSGKEYQPRGARLAGGSLAGGPPPAPALYSNLPTTH